MAERINKEEQQEGTEQSTSSIRKVPIRRQSSSSLSCPCPPTAVTLPSSDSLKSFQQCPICLGKFTLGKTPIGLKCGHLLCLPCVRVLMEVEGSMESLDLSIGIPNVPLLAYLEEVGDGEEILGGLKKGGDQDLLQCLSTLSSIVTSKSHHNLSRAIHRKLLNLLASLNPSGQAKLLRGTKSIAERCLQELTSSTSNLSHYQAQQQLWGAIRGKSCQFMGPAVQEEALKLVLLALEDGSALSRKVLVMFVVQRLEPQYQQASKTSVGHIIQLLYRAGVFEVLKRPENSSLLVLKPEFRTYDSLRREHDTQIIQIGLESGIRFSPEQWSNLLYGDGGKSNKGRMQSIIDKLQSPQSYDDLLKEFLVCVQRLEEEDEEKRGMYIKIYGEFKRVGEGISPGDPVPSTSSGVQSSVPTWSSLSLYFDSLREILTLTIAIMEDKNKRQQQGSSRGYRGGQRRRTSTTGPNRSRTTSSNL